MFNPSTKLIVGGDKSKVWGNFQEAGVNICKSG